MELTLLSFRGDWNISIDSLAVLVKIGVAACIVKEFEA